MPKQIDFYYFTGSTYTYLAVNRVTEAAERAGVEVRWRPFNLRALLRENGHVPFPAGRAKTAYMWRDLQRRALMYGMAFPETPPPYPCDPDLLNFRVALVAYEQGWAREHALASYQWWFLKSRPPGMDDNRIPFLLALGKDPESVIDRAHSREIDAMITESEDEARALGLFGSPHFVVEGEVFWGDDRLEDALAWATRGPRQEV
jgi:2-hydroxychromene-2-carboxylate isomerase